MAKPIDPIQLKALADDIQGLLEVYGIEAEIFTLSVRIPPKYYESIKENFPDRHRIDLVVGSSEEDWHITLLCSPFASSKDDG